MIYLNYILKPKYSKKLKVFPNDANNKVNVANINNNNNAIIKQAVDTRQTSLLLNKYLMTLYLEESLKKRFKEDEEHAVVNI